MNVQTFSIICLLLSAALGGCVMKIILLRKRLKVEKARALFFSASMGLLANERRKALSNKNTVAALHVLLVAVGHLLDEAYRIEKITRSGLNPDADDMR